MDELEEERQAADEAVALLLECKAAILRLRTLLLDVCEVFDRYDLPEHALHYRRALERL